MLPHRKIKYYLNIALLTVQISRRASNTGDFKGDHYNTVEIIRGSEDKFVQKEFKKAIFANTIYGQKGDYGLMKMDFKMCELKNKGFQREIGASDIKSGFAQLKTIATQVTTALLKLVP